MMMFVSRIWAKSAFPRLISIRLQSSSSTESTAFPFLPTNKLPAKPNRKKGLTEIRGSYYAPVTHTYLDELLADWGEYVDGIK